jgi:hypothetical protein
MYRRENANGNNDNQQAAHSESVGILVAFSLATARQGGYRKTNFRSIG